MRPATGCGMWPWMERLMQARPVVELAGILRREGRGSMIASDTNVFVPFLTQADLTGPRQASALFSG
ncbi:hypothetical protein [Paracoccus sp. (in: a-proteobacteria)]